MNTVDVEPRSDLFAFLNAGVGAQRAGRLRLHLGGRSVLLQHDRRSAVFCGVGRLLHDTPKNDREEKHVWISFWLRSQRADGHV